MSRIICGMFDNTLDADAALEELKGDGFQRSEVDAFYVSPPGQHGMTAVGGDSPHSSEGSRGAGIGAGVGAAIGAAVGAAAGWVASAAADLGIIVIPLGAGLGAYVGSFAGSMARVRGGKRASASVEHPVEPRGGRMIAINVDRSGTEKRAIEILKRRGARDVRRAEGQWADGSWRDFDPRAPLAAV
ncbi:MAG: hypothetical protein K0R40_694 [Burkholderiales bacterium]|jgi:hypothetical protein|nr:hypothetical protein [Burkholderiales bacterium]